MTVFLLKLAAAVLMLTDHLGIVLYQHQAIGFELYHWMRTLGRFAFPIYCFLLAEGFRHLRKDPKRLCGHMLLLLVLAVCSEPFFDQLLTQRFDDAAHQSVILTLILGFGGLWLSECFRDRPLPRFAVLLFAGALGRFLHTDYGVAGVFLIFGCYFYLERWGQREFGRRLLGVLCLIVGYLLFYSWVRAGFGGPAAVCSRLFAMGDYLYPFLLLIPALASYGGRPGRRNKLLHRCYQCFYPAHLAALYLLGLLL